MLTVILSYTHVLLQDQHDPTVRADIEEIARAGQRARDLTAQLLAFSRQQILQPRVLDPSEVIEGMAKMLHRLLGEDIELLLATHPAGHVYVDPHQLEQIVMNLAVNARDAMPQGGKLSIETDPVVVDGTAFIQITVTDTGVGMTDAQRERIFEPFFTTKETGRGTGLGLSTVFGIVSQSRGQISVDSAPGRGTTFTIRLPRTERAKLPAVGAAAPKSVRGSETILLTEDDSQVRRVTQMILRRHGYKVLDAQNGGEAMLICEKHPGRIDLLLTDIVMPHMSGRELARRLSSGRPEMRVLFMSGYTPDANSDVEVPFLNKPLSPETLLNKIREILDGPTR